MITPDENNSIFQLAEDFINQTSEHLFLTGKAGTGKTTFLKHIRENTHKRAIVAAPTGVAAINAGGVTLHSLFQLPFEPYIPGYSNASLQKNYFRFAKQKLDMLRKLELLIIDEASMLRADTLDAIDATLRIVRRNNRQPFGGVQVLFIGDMFQLPPVAKEDEWKLLGEYYPSTFFFEAQVIAQTRPIYLELKKVYRQGDPVFVDLLNRIRNNAATRDDLQLLNQRFIPKFEYTTEDNYIILTTHNHKADRINDSKLQELTDAPPRIFFGTKDGDFPDYALPAEKELRLKEGAQVMFIKNDPEHRYYNGKIARVSQITADQIYVYIPELNKDILVGKETWENKRFSLDKETGEITEELLGTFSQYPLRLAWAITIHKSQGLTFEKAIIDIGSSFAAGQAYVALSRCVSLEGIVLFSKIHPGCIFTDQRAIEFSQNEKKIEDLQRLFRQGKRKFWVDRLLQYFEWKTLHTLLRDMERLLQEKDGVEYQPAHKLLTSFKRKVSEQEGISLKFRQQLMAIVQQDSADEDISFLRERCCKAVEYFHKEVAGNILVPLQGYITEFKGGKKAKVFLNNLIRIEEGIILFLEDMKRVRYNNVPLTEDLDLPVPRRQGIFTK
ncbi:DEAD/DEAH box helicase [Bacteroidales bacterium OttesenSCG-928-J19]|nr:DEAD/DEAH box helicase [Bacteroidales bacterium OttesenSCG-928-J19]